MSTSETGGSYAAPRNGAESRVVAIEETYKELSLRNQVDSLGELTDLLSEDDLLSGGYRIRARRLGDRIISLISDGWDIDELPE